MDNCHKMLVKLTATVFSNDLKAFGERVRSFVTVKHRQYNTCNVICDPKNRSLVSKASVNVTFEKNYYNIDLNYIKRLSIFSVEKRDKGGKIVIKCF